MLDEWGGIEIGDEFGGVAVEEESTPPDDRPPRGEMLEPEIPRPRYSLDEPVPGGKPVVNVESRTVERLPASLEAPESVEPARVIPPFTMEEFRPRTATAENPYGVATPEERAFTAAQPSEFDRPVIPSSVFRTALDIGSATLPRSEMLEGFKEGAAEQLAGMTSQSGVAMLPAFAIPYVGPALAMGMGAKAVGAGVGRTVGALEPGDLREVGSGLSEVVGGGLMVAAPLMHGGITRPAIPPRIIETITKAEAAVPGALSKSKAALEQVATKDVPKQLEKPIEAKGETSAIQEQSSSPGVLRQERSEVGLQEVRQPQAEIVDAIPREPARGQGGEEGQVLLTRLLGAVKSGKSVEGASGNAREFGKTLTTAEEIAALKAEHAINESEYAQALEALGPNPTDAQITPVMLEHGLKGQYINEAIDGATGAWEFKTGPNKDVAKFRQLREAGQPINEKAIPADTEVATPTTADQAQVPAGQASVVEQGVGAVPENVPATGAAKFVWKGEDLGQQPVIAFRQRDGTILADPSARIHATAAMDMGLGSTTASPLEPGFVVGKQFIPGSQAGNMAPVRAAQAAAKPALASAEAKLSQVVNQTIEQSSSTRLGVSPAATMRPMDVVLGAPDLRSISPAVEARWQQAVKGTEGIIEKVKQHADEAWKSVTREYAELPPREFPAEIDVLRRQRASPNASARTAVDVLKGITNNLGPKQYGVFNRVALLEDLIKDVESGKYATGNDLPFGYKDAGELTADLNKFRSVAESTPQIKAALERRQEFMDSMRGTLVERGFLPESVLSDPRYFHHQVLMYMAEKNAPAGSRSFRDWFSGWQKKRTGSSKDYNRQYVEAEAEVLADAFNKFTNQDLHGEMQGIADIASQLKEVHGAEWRQHIPKSYTTWQPKRGNIFYQVQTVAERVMDRYLSGLGDILPSEFKEALAMGGRKQEWVIPKPLAKVLDNIAPRPDTWIGRLATAAQNSWKRYILLNPLRAAKYNLNNLSGDLDFLFAAQPKIFKEFKSSASDMWGFHVKGKSATGDIKDAIQDGVIGSGWRASELPDIARSDYFNWLTGEKPKLVDRYWDWIGKRSDAREDTGRLASYRFAKKEWEAGRPFYGASVPADVNALATPRLKAAKVAREILIDYGRGTEFSNFTRQKLVPFFKWMEGNFVRYQQLIRNVSEHEGAGPRVAGVAGKKAATLGLRLGAAYGVVNLWNHMFFPNEEEELGEGRNQLHLILGRDDQGNVQTIRFQGALSDLLGWVGGEDLPQDVKDLATGKASVGDKMEDAYEAAISRGVNASLPFPKTAAEVGLGRSFYPNALQPRPVRDKAEHAAGLFSLKPVYQWLAGKPHKPLRQELANLIAYTTDPGEAAYNTTRHMAGEWLEEHGEERANVIPGKRSNALYYYKQALRYKDQETAKKFLDEYNKLGGKREGLSQSIKASAPLSMLGKQRGAFLDSLSPQEQESVKRAEEWYRKVYER